VAAQLAASEEEKDRLMFIFHTTPLSLGALGSVVG
jgi:hypothetical protein